MSSAEASFKSKIDKIKAITEAAVKVLKNKESKISLPVPTKTRTFSLGSEQDFELEEDDNEDEQLIKASSSDAIERWIALKAKDMNKKEGATKPINTLKTEELPHDSKGIFTGFQRMVSSPNKNDCLIHSLLTSLSPTFRTLEKENKDLIASNFRREILWTLLNDSKDTLPYQFTKAHMDQMLAETRSYGFLSDLHLRYLVNKYTFNVFFYELGAPRTDPWHLLMPYDGSETAPLIFLYNPGRNHFEAVRDPITDNYIFDLNFLKPFRNITVFTNQSAVNKEKGLQRCPFIVWDVLKKKDTDELFVVVDQIEQDGKCINQFVTAYTADKNLIKHIVNKPREHKDERIDIFPTKDEYELATHSSRHYDQYKTKGGKQTRKNKSKK